MHTLTAHDWIQIGTVLIALGVFINQARSTRTLVDQHEQRLRAVESQTATSAALLVRATSTLDRLEKRMEETEKELMCETHSAMMTTLHEEINRLRDRVDRVVG